MTNDKEKDANILWDAKASVYAQNHVHVERLRTYEALF